MAYEVEFTGEFEEWWDSLDADEQDSVNFSVRLLQELGIHLKRPHADTVNRVPGFPTCVSCAASMKEGHTGFCLPSIHDELRFC